MLSQTPHGSPKSGAQPKRRSAAFVQHVLENWKVLVALGLTAAAVSCASENPDRVERQSLEPGGLVPADPVFTPDGSGGGSGSGSSESGVGASNSVLPPNALPFGDDTFEQYIDPPREGSQYCGDGAYDPALEECDDGIGSALDLCTEACQTRDILAVPAASGGRVLSRKLGLGRHPISGGYFGSALTWVDASAAPQVVVQLREVHGNRIEEVVVADATLLDGDASQPTLASHPVVATLPDGTHVVAYNDLNGDGNELGVALRSVSHLTGTLGDVRFANTTVIGAQQDPDLIWTEEGLVAAWVDTSDDLNGPDIRYRIFDEDLQPGPELTLAETSLPEGAVTLSSAAGAESWAAAWRRGEADGTESIVVSLGGERIAFTPEWDDVSGASVGIPQSMGGAGSGSNPSKLMPGHIEDRLGLAPLGENLLAVAFTVGTDPQDTGVANVFRLWTAVVDFSVGGVVWIGPVAPLLAGAPDENHSQRSPALADASPVHLPGASGKVFLGWRAEAVLGDAIGEELWLKRLDWDEQARVLILTEEEVPLTRDEGSRPGAQRQPAFANVPVPGGHALSMAWEDWGVNFDASDDEQARPDIVVQVAPVPLRRDENRLLDCSYASCGIGTGPCEIDDDCAGGLICAKGRGPWYGYSPEVAVCAPETCTNGARDAGEAGVDCGGECGPCFECESPSSSLGTAHFCSAVCQCENTEGDCDSDFDCVRDEANEALDLTCVESVGDLMGWPEPLDLCLRAQCTNGVKDADEDWVDCGGPNCPTCLDAIPLDCSVTACTEGQAGCTSTSECESGLECATGQGELYGYASGTNACVPAGCETGRGGAFSATACSADCPCGSGVGQCSSDDDCLGSKGDRCIAERGLYYAQDPSFSVCVPSQCFNGEKDANETRIDCGGPCGRECPICQGDHVFRSFNDLANSNLPVGQRGWEFVSGDGITWTRNSSVSKYGSSSLEFGGTGTATIRGPSFSGSVFDILGEEFQLDLALLDGGGSLPASIAQSSDLKIGIYHPTLGTKILIDTAFVQSPSGEFLRQSAPLPAELLEAIALDEDGFQLEVQIDMPASTTGPILRLDYMQLSGENAVFRSICRDDATTGDPSGDLFGFEDASLWSSAETNLSLYSSPRQGDFAVVTDTLAVGASPTITSVPFELGSSVMSKLLLDIQLPSAGSNATVSLLLDCDSNNYAQQDSGLVPAAATGQWITVPFTLPGLVDAMEDGATGCTIEITTTPNAAGAIVYDHLRFAPDTYCATSLQVDDAPFAVGTTADGSASDPYRLCNAAQIQSLMDDSALWSKNFQLEADIDLSEVVGQIGTGATYFKGTFDGQNHYLSNYTFSGGDYAGLFGYVRGDGLIDGTTDGVVKNLTAAEFHVSGTEWVGTIAGTTYEAQLLDLYVASGSAQGTSDSVGGLVGYARNSTLLEGVVSGADVGPTIGDSSGGLVGRLYQSIIRRSRSHGSVTVGPTMGSSDVGGLVGMARSSSTIEDSTASGNVQGGGSNTGGFVGDLREGSVIRGCLAEGTVSSSDDDVGGFAGFSWDAILERVKATGHVIGANAVGGLVGRLDGGSIADGSAGGTVTGLDWSGGLVGETMNGGAISRSSAKGDVVGGNQVGGLVGRCQDTSLQDSFASGNVHADLSRAGGVLGTTANCSLERTHAFGSSSTDGTMVGTIAAGNYDAPSPDVPTSFADSFGASTPNPGLDAVYSSPSEPGATNLTSVQFRDESNFTNWDFFGVWEMGENFPELRRSACELYEQIDAPPFLVGMATEPNGTALHPYRLCNAAQIVHVMENPTEEYGGGQDLWDSNFVLESDIDLSDVDMNALTWGQIGTVSDQFRGTFNGAGHRIRGYTLTLAANGAALFGRTSSSGIEDGSLDGIIENLVLEDFEVTGENYVAAAVGLSNGTVRNVIAVRPVINGSVYYTGGLVGLSYGTIERSAAHDIDVTGGTGHTGGLVGNSSSNALVADCLVEGGVVRASSGAVGGAVGVSDSVIVRTTTNLIVETDGDNNYGGLVGSQSSSSTSPGRVEDCHAHGPVSGKDCTGGLIGRLSGPDTLVINSSAHGHVVGEDYVGGLVGYMYDETQVLNSQATGDVEAKGIRAGGFVGYISEEGTLVVDSSATGGVRGAGQAGGFVGRINGGTILRGVASGVVTTNTGTNNAGGFAALVDGDARIEASEALGDVNGGQHNNGGFAAEAGASELFKCIARGNVSGGNSNGGFVGFTRGGARISSCSSTGDVVGDSHTAGFSGYVRGGAVLQKCSASGDVEQRSGNYAGGFAGYTREYLGFAPLFDQCSASGNVSSVGFYVGGLVGRLQEGVIQDSRSEGRVYADAFVGGLVGRVQQGGAIVRSSAGGDVESMGNHAGGLVGQTVDSFVTDSYAHGSVTAGSNAGGLIGDANSTIVVRALSYGSAEVNSGNVGSLLGYADVTTEVSAVFSRPEATEVEEGDPPLLPTGNNGALDAQITELTTEQFKEASHFTSAGWDFQNTWQMGRDAPELRDGYCITNEQMDEPPFVVVAEGETAPTGGEDDPYVLCNASQIAALMASEDPVLLGKNFRVAQSISLNGLDGQIGDAAGGEPFTGTFDGGGQALLNYAPAGQTDDAGLFSAVVGDGTLDGVSDGVVKNVVLSAPTVAGANRVGAVVGSLTNGQLENVEVIDAVVSGTSNVGGIVGLASGGSRIVDSKASGQVDATAAGASTVGGLAGQLDAGALWDSHSSASVSVNGSYGGGLLGRATDSALSVCSATGDVQALDFAGGLVGLSTNTSTTRCWATGSSTATAGAAGGLLGASVDGLVNDAYATGGVSGTTSSGGLIGYAQGTSISRTFATGVVAGGGANGGLVGSVDGDVFLSGSFGSSSANGSLALVGNGSDQGSSYLTDAEFTDWSNFQDEGWQFGGIWKSGAAGPELSTGADLDSQPCLAYAHADGAPFLLGMPATPDGTEDNPWPVCSRDHFQDIIADTSLWGDHFVLLTDVSLAGLSGQIGTEVQPFVGSFDGSEHTLSNYSLDSAANYAGLFGRIGAVGIGPGTVRDLTLEGFDVSGGSLVGALAGSLEVGSTLDSVRVVGGTVSGYSTVGGLIGGNGGGTILNCDASASVTGADQSLGGLVGQSSASGQPLPAGLISGSSASGAVDGDDTAASLVGGLVGFLVDGVVHDSSASGAVDGLSYVGGLVGGLAYDNSTAKIFDSSASGTVSGDQVVGGLVGSIVDSGPGTARAIVERSSASGPVAAVTYVAGGLVGLSSNLTVKDCFATGDVNAAYAGGLIGYVYSGQVIGSYASGAVTGPAAIGALSGVGGGGVLDLFNSFVVSDSNPNLPILGDSSQTFGAVAATAAELSDPDFLAAAGWDTVAIWQTGAGLATLAAGDGELPFCERFTPTVEAPFIAETEDAAAGTHADPYKICSVEQLQAIADSAELLGAHYELAAHLDLSSFDDQIGTGATPFSGTLEGKGYLLHDFVHSGAGSETGLFGVVSGDGTSTGLVRGLNLTRFDVDGAGNVGSLVGELAGGLVEAVQVRSSSVSGTSDNVGGLVGLSSGTLRDALVDVSTSVTTGKAIGGAVGYSSGLLEGVFAVGDVAATTVEAGAARPIGGLIGEAATGTVSDCFASGAVSTVGDRAGGLIGDMGEALLTDSEATGNVSSQGLRAGGLVGLLDGTVRRSRARGAVRAEARRAGGLVGDAQNGAVVEDSHAYGDVSAPYETGGLLGYIAGSGANIYRSSAHGHVFGDYEVGGLIGNGNNNTAGQGIVEDCYAAGVAFATDYRVGGLIGRADTLTVTDSYARNSVNRPPGGEAGAVAGTNLSNTSTFSGVYYDFDTSNLPAVGNGSSVGTNQAGFGAIRTQSTYAAWDFTNVWEMGVDGPRLLSEGAESDFCILNDPDNGAPFTVGTGAPGSVANPFHICQGDQLDALADDTAYWDDFIVLDADVDLLNLSVQIGTTATPFTGYFDGQRHQILNYSNTGSGTDVGLFGHVSGNGYSTGTVQNLVMGDVNVLGDTNVGPFIGWLESGAARGLVIVDSSVDGTGNNIGGLIGRCDGSLSDSWVDMAVDADGGRALGGAIGFSSGSVERVVSTSVVTLVNNTTDAQTGGLIGSTSGATVTDCHTYGDVTANNDEVGGLIGDSDTSTITDCSASGAISTTDDGPEVGGLVGLLNYGSVVSNCFATGPVSGYRKVGGLVGYLANSAIIEDSWATGDVTSSSYDTGGLVGHVHTSGATIARSWASGNVDAERLAGGLIGRMRAGTVDDSYSLGDVDVTEEAGEAGGFIGEVEDAAIDDCYSFGKTDQNSSNTNSGAFIGERINTTVSTSYANGDVNGTFSDVAVGSGSGASNQTEAWFAVESNYASSWDFSNVWIMDASAGRAVLR